MLDYQRIVDDARSLLCLSSADGDDFFRAVAGDYSLAVDDVNQRLRQCGSLLRKGLRSEAIQLCEIEPNLLDIVATLDFPEREQWNERLAGEGMVPPAPLMLDVAADLNEAYAVEQPLATLLQRHRLLALARAPLKLRLETLRKLAAADPNNPVWEEDVRVFERERTKLMQQEVMQAIQTGDLESLNSIGDELEQGEWHELPEALSRQIAGARERFAQQKLLADLGEVERNLNDAFAAFDVDTGRLLREQWDVLSAVPGLNVPADVEERTAPALRWLVEQDEMEARQARLAEATGALRAAITLHKPREALVRLHRAVMHEGDVPADLEKRYRQRIDELDRAIRRRNWSGIAGCLGGLLLIGALVAALVLHSQRKHELEAAVQNLNRLIDQGNLSEAGNYVERLQDTSPRVAADVRIREAVGRLEKLQTVEDDQRTAFLAAVETVRKSLAEGAPDDDALTQATRLAATEADKLVVSGLRADIRKWEQKGQDQRGRVFQERLTDLRKRIAELEKDVEDSPQACVARAAALSDELSKLEETAQKAGAEARKDAELARARLNAVENGAKANLEHGGKEEEITAACGDTARFRQQLIAYARRFPNSRRAVGFERVANDARLWEWIERWNELVLSLRQTDSERLTRKSSAAYAEKIKKLLDERAGHPDADAFRRCLAYLQAIAGREGGEGNPIEDKIKTLLADKLLTEAWYVEDADGRRFYMLGDPKIDETAGRFNPNRMQGIRYLVGFDLNATKNESLPARKILRVGTAPQVQLAARLRLALDAMHDSNWEASFFAMAQRVVKDEETDPVLKLVLLRQLLTVGCQGSQCLKKGFQRHLDALGQSAINDAANWIDPNDAEGAQARETAKEELAALPDLTAAGRISVESLRSFDPRIGTEYRWIGWLRQGKDRTWRCAVRWEQADLSGSLFIISGGEKEAVVEPVGRLEQSMAKINADGSKTLVEGRPVYLAIPPNRAGKP